MTVRSTAAAAATVTAVILALLLSLMLPAVDAHRAALSSSSSESESSSSSSSATTAADVVLGLVATLPPTTSSRRRSLLDRPATTCGDAAFPKDAEVEELHTWLFRMADTLGIARASCTAMGLQITEGTMSFTVICVGNPTQLSSFAPDGATVAGATLSSTVIVDLAAAVDITLDAGSKVILEANLKTLVPPGLPSAVSECSAFLAVEAAAALPDPPGARRHLFADPTTQGPEAFIEETVDGVLNDLATLSGIPRSKWNAQDARLLADVDGVGNVVLFVVFVEATTTETDTLVQNWGAITAAFDEDDFSFGTEIVVIPESDAPTLSATLAENLQVSVSPVLQGTLDQGSGTIPINNTPAPA